MRETSRRHVFLVLLGFHGSRPLPSEDASLEFEIRRQGSETLEPLQVSTVPRASPGDEVDGPAHPFCRRLPRAGQPGP
ncbi:hypothetical protein [Mesorhizobium sp. M0847]|uniref:hypothetical protein n=1 Tax=unclassified Mesorhizobium TaxID=325217 RepID=UPI003334FAD2